MKITFRGLKIEIFVLWSWGIIRHFPLQMNMPRALQMQNKLRRHVDKYIDTHILDAAGRG